MSWITYSRTSSTRTTAAAAALALAQEVQDIVVLFFVVGREPAVASSVRGFGRERAEVKEEEATRTAIRLTLNFMIALCFGVCCIFYLWSLGLYSLSER